MISISADPAAPIPRQVRVVVYCDGCCGCHIADDVQTEPRAPARAAGYTFDEDGRHWCPICRTTRKLQDLQPGQLDLF